MTLMNAQLLLSGMPSTLLPSVTGLESHDLKTKLHHSPVALSIEPFFLLSMPWGGGGREMLQCSLGM